MPKYINQKITFKNTSPEVLYELYMNAKKHAAAISSSAHITSKEGAEFNVWDNYITGKNLRLIKNQLIVQEWRASDWGDADANSTLILFFEKKGKNTIVHMIHSGVPDNQAEGLYQGWMDFYWNKWDEFLSRSKAKKKK